MKVGIDSYCYHRFFGEVLWSAGRANRRMTYKDFLHRAIDLKVDGVSLETCFFGILAMPISKSSGISSIRATWEPVVAWGPPRALRAAMPHRPWPISTNMYRVCHILGANVMRVVGSSLDFRNDPHEPQLKALTGIFKEAAQVAEGEGVKLAMENHFDFTTDEFMDLVNRVNSPYFGVCFDTGNALRIGDDPVVSASMLSKYIFATHTKDVKPIYGVSPKEWYFFACVPVGQGIINMPGLVDALLATGYQGLFAIELDYAHPEVMDEDVAVEQSVKYLQELQAQRR